MSLLGIRGKDNNRRRYPGESSRNRPDRAAERRADAEDRQKAYNDLTPQQRLDRLDSKFGVGQGARNEREKLLKAIEAGKKKKTSPSIDDLATQTLPDEIMAEIDAINDEVGSKKKLKAKDRRARDSKTNK